MNKIAVLGTGNIGKAIIEGLISKNSATSAQIIATRRNIQTLQDLKVKGVTITSNNSEAVKFASVIILAVKPFKVPEIIEEIKNDLTEKHIVVSVASEVSIQQIHDWIGRDLSIFRMMPNTASSIQQSITCISHNKKGEKEIASIKEIGSAIGESIIIDETLMEAATILGACGIAYVLRFIRAMIQGGVQIGFDAQTAKKITMQTVKGAAELLIQNNTHPEQEIDKVTTPKGCTITGLNEMEHQGFSSSLIHGIVKSFNKIEK